MEKENRRGAPRRVSASRVAESAQVRFCRFAGLIAAGTNSGNYHNCPPDPSRPNRDSVRSTDTVGRSFGRDAVAGIAGGTRRFSFCPLNTAPVFRASFALGNFRNENIIAGSTRRPMSSWTRRRAVFALVSPHVNRTSSCVFLKTLYTHRDEIINDKKIMRY